MEKKVGAKIQMRSKVIDFTGGFREREGGESLDEGCVVVKN